VNLQQVDGNAKQAFDAPLGAPDIDPCLQRDFIDRLEHGVQAVTISQADENLDVEEPLRDKRLTKDDRGAALAESAIALPLIVVIFGTIFAFGSTLRNTQVLETAARDSARYLAHTATTSANETTARNIAVYANAAGGARTISSKLVTSISRIRVP